MSPLGNHWGTYIEVQNQVKYGGKMDYFPSRCFWKLLNTEGIKVRHWIDLSAGTELLSLPKLLTKIWPFKSHF